MPREQTDTLKFISTDQFNENHRPRPSAELLPIARQVCGGRLLLGISGKDSLAMWLYLRENGFEIIPYMFYTVPPGLSFEIEARDMYEQFFGTHITWLPHPNFYKFWNRGDFQSPVTRALQKSLHLPELDYHEIEDILADENNLGIEYLSAQGYKASDNPGRRRLINNMGAIGMASRHYYFAIWDWTNGRCMEIIKRYGAPLSRSYDLFNCTFDEYDYQVLTILYDESRADFDLLKTYFPLIGLRVVRHYYVE